MKEIIGLTLIWIIYKIGKFLFGHHHVVEYTNTGLPCYPLHPRQLENNEEPGFGDIEFFCKECGKRCVDHDHKLGEIECQIQMYKERNNL
jgi:hypothetical protein